MPRLNTHKVADRDRNPVGWPVLRVGHPKVRMYDASMIEWGNRPELPLEK